MSDISPEIVKTAAATLVAEGGAPGSSLHSWRCEHPERYGSCNCVTMTVEEIIKAIEPLMRAEILRECHVMAHVWSGAPGRKECLCPNDADHDGPPLDLWDEQKVKIRSAVLSEEADWLDTAYANSADKGYSAVFRKGFKTAAGWVRFHANNPHLLDERAARL